MFSQVGVFGTSKSALQTDAPQLSALMTIFLSVGPVISTFRTSRAAGAGATRQVPSRTAFVSGRNPSSAPRLSSSCRVARAASSSRRVGSNVRARSATNTSASGERISSDRSTAGPVPRISTPLPSEVATLTSACAMRKPGTAMRDAPGFERRHGSGLPRPRPSYSPAGQTPYSVTWCGEHSRTNEHVEPLQIVTATPPVEATLRILSNSVPYLIGVAVVRQPAGPDAVAAEVGRNPWLFDRRLTTLELPDDALPANRAVALDWPVPYHAEWVGVPPPLLISRLCFAGPTARLLPATLISRQTPI